MDFINIIGTIIDNSIEHVVTFAHMIKDLRLNKNQQEINEDFENTLGDLSSEDIRINEILNMHGQSISNLQESVEDIGTLEDTTNQIEGRVNNLEDADTEILQRISEIEKGNIDVKDKVPHKFISQKGYDRLNSYEKDTLYIILENFDYSSSVFGDTFPLIFGESPSHFGEVLPFTLK